jgi:uncharacterized protein YecT (DUF1311 family)/TPR repeat protein
MRASVHLIAILLFVFAAPAIAQDKTPAEMAVLKAAADTGRADAELAFARALGDTPAAREWAQKAADQGLAEAWFWLGGVISAKGDPIPYYAKAAELGYDKAFDYLLDDLLFRAAEKADVVQAKKFGDLARRRNVKLGSDTPEMLDTIDRCFEAGKPVIPPADRPSEAERKALEGEGECAPFLSPAAGRPDYRKYRACLLSQTLPENRWLAEVYANGWAVRRNPKLALSLICHGSDVPAELMGMARTLYESRDEATLDPPSLFCEHVTSGMNAGVCSMRSEGLAEAKRDAAWTGVTAGWPAPQRAAFRAMRTAADAFFETRSSGELDQSGTAHLAMAIDEVASLQDALLASVREFEAGKLPPRAALAAADAELNAVYAAIMKREALDLGTITKESIRETQRKWLVYRDAWAAFAARRYPRRSADEWKAWMTTVRIAQLKELS